MCAAKEIKGMKIRELKAVLKDRGVKCKGRHVALSLSNKKRKMFCYLIRFADSVVFLFFVTGCSSKTEYAKKVKETNHLDKPKSSAGSADDAWMMEMAWNCAKGLFAMSPLLLLGSVFCCAFEDEEDEVKKRKKRDDFKAGG